jgi:hypothetical protein
MKKPKRIFFTPTEKSEKMEVVMRRVKLQVKKYRLAKRDGTVKKPLSSDSGQLFSV